MQCRAAEKHFWISTNNSTASPSCWGSLAVRPDGLINGRLPTHRAGVVVTEMTPDPNCFDATALWRLNVMTGQLPRGSLVDHPRSREVALV